MKAPLGGGGLLESPSQDPGRAPGSRIDKNRILWRCRRGMRELDMLLQGFVASHYDRLSAAQQLRFAALLNEADVDIMAWFIGLRAAPDPEYRQLIDLLRQFAEENVCPAASGPAPS